MDRKLMGFLLIAMVAMSSALAACNTTAGAGRDIESVGDAIEDTAEDAQN